MSNIPSSSAPGTRQTVRLARRPRMKWHHVYFLLAAFNVFTVTLSLFLNYQLVETNKATVYGNLQWVTWIKQCDVLAKQAGQVNAPGNDVLNSHDVPAESNHLAAAVPGFKRTLSGLHADLLHNVRPNNAVSLLNDCSYIGQQLDELLAQIDTVFALTRDGKLDQIEPRIAQKSRDYDAVLRGLDQLRVDLRDQREAYLEGQVIGANTLQRYEWLLGLLIVIMVIGTVGYGVRLDHHVSGSETKTVEAQERYRLLVEQSTDAILVADDDWNIRFANQAACQMFGYTHEEMLQLNAEDTYTPEDGHLAAARKQAIPAGDGSRYERAVRRKDGTRFLAEVIVRRLDQGGSQAIFRDITERKRGEEQLLLQSAALEAAANGIVITDSRGVILWVNTAFTSLSGYSAEEVIGQTPSTLKSGEHDGSFYRELWETISAGRVWQGEIINRRKDGVLYTEDMTITPVRDGAGQISRFVAIKQDVTQRKEGEQSLRETNRRLEHALEELQTAQQQVVQQERLRALGTMASGVAHDFNNALAGILGFTELLVYKPEILDDKAKTMEYLGMMNTAAKDASNVVNRLREFYRPRDRNEVFAPVDLNHLVEEALSLTQPKWKTQAEARGIRIRTEIDLQEIPPVAGNAADLREALTNLIFNAVDAMPRGGTITIRTRPAASTVTLEVMDTGLGMSEEVAPSLPRTILYHRRAKAAPALACPWCMESSSAMRAPSISGPNSARARRSLFPCRRIGSRRRPSRALRLPLLRCPRSTCCWLTTKRLSARS